MSFVKRHRPFPRIPIYETTILVQRLAPILNLGLAIHKLDSTFRNSNLLNPELNNLWRILLTTLIIYDNFRRVSIKFNFNTRTAGTLAPQLSCKFPGRISKRCQSDRLLLKDVLKKT